MNRALITLMEPYSQNKQRPNKVRNITDSLFQPFNLPIHQPATILHISKQNISFFEQPEVVTGDIKSSQNGCFSFGELIGVFSNLIQLIIDQFRNFIYLLRIFITSQQVFIVQDPDSNWIFHISEFTNRPTKNEAARILKN